MPNHHRADLHNTVRQRACAKLSFLPVSQPASWLPRGRAIQARVALTAAELVSSQTSR